MAIHVCLAILLDVRAMRQFIRRWPGDAKGTQSAKGVISNSDAIADLLELIEHFLNRLDIYTEIHTTPAMNELVVKILADIITILALVTGKLKQRRSSESLLANVLLYSARRSQIRKEIFQREGHRGGATED